MKGIRSEAVKKLFNMSESELIYRYLKNPKLTVGLQSKFLDKYCHSEVGLNVLQAAMVFAETKLKPEEPRDDSPGAFGQPIDFEFNDKPKRVIEALESALVKCIANVMANSLHGFDTSKIVLKT